LQDLTIGPCPNCRTCPLGLLRSRRLASSGDSSDYPKLFKVDIKCKGVRNAQTLYHHLARAVDEAPLLIVVVGMGSGLALPHPETTSLLTVKQMQNSKTWFLFSCSLISDSFLLPSVTRLPADGNPCLSRECGLPR